MLIAVCDDHAKDRAKLTETLHGILVQRRLSAELREFPSGEALLSAMEKESFSICFLDIFMDGISGVAVARRIRQNKTPAAIVFTTGSRDHMADGFEVGAVHYLVKPFIQDAVEIALDRCLLQVGETERFVEVMVDREPRRVLLSKLRWAESRSNACTLRMEREELITWLSLEELETMLQDNRFLRCQRSYLVNLDYVAALRGNNFLLSDGTQIPVSRESRTAIKERFEKYLFEKARRRR